MYLTKKTYIGANYEHNKVKGKIMLKKDGNAIPIQLDRVSYIEERVGYWRKANQIHGWFVSNIQDGVDDCGSYELTKEKANELLSICRNIKQKCSLVDGQVKNGQVASVETGGKFVDAIEDGNTMTNSEVAEKLLPSESGFFFGSTDYDQWYMESIDETIEILEAIMGESDPDKDYFSAEVYYQSSW